MDKDGDKNVMIKKKKANKEKETGKETEKKKQLNT